MIPYIGDFAEDASVVHYFNTFSSDDPSASVTITNLIDSDIDVYKDGGVTEIATDGATVAINFDSRTGVHKITIDTSAHSDYAVGSDYMVAMLGTTIDSGTVNAALFTFSIENRYNAAADDLANGTDGLGAIKAETAAIVADTSELQTDNVPGLISTLDAVVDTVKAETALIVADTNELQSDNVPTLISTLDAVVDTVKAETVLILADTEDIQTQIGTAGDGLTAIPGFTQVIAGVLDEDVQLEDTVYLPFNTISGGLATALVGGAVDIYEDVTATPIITGETITVSLNSLAGFNMVTVAATSAGGFGAGQDYTAVLQAGTVGGVSVVGEIVGHFTVDKSAAALDLANGTDGLTRIKADTAATLVDTDELQGDWADAGRLDAILDARMAEASIDTTGGAVDLVTATTTAANLTTNNDKTGYALSTAGVLAIWHQAVAAIVTASSIGKLLIDEITSVRMAVLTDWIDGGRLDTLLDAIPTTTMRGTDDAALATALTTAQADLDIITGADGVVLKVATQASIDAIEVDTGTTLQAELDGIQADTENIQTRLPTALVSGKMDSDMIAIDSNTAAAVQLALSAGALESGAAEGTPTITVIQTDLAETQDDIYIGAEILFTSGAARGERTDITDYTGSTGTLLVTALVNAPSSGDTFVLY